MLLSTRVNPIREQFYDVHVFAYKSPSGWDRRPSVYAIKLLGPPENGVASSRATDLQASIVRALRENKPVGQSSQCRAPTSQHMQD